MYVRHLNTVSTMTSPALAGTVASAPIAADLLTVSPGRLGALLAGLLGLTGLVIGGLAVARPTGQVGTDSRPFRATVALAAGLLGTALGGLALLRTRRAG